MQKNIPIRRSVQRYQRTIAGSAILIIAFIAAILIAHEANRTVLLWSTSNELSTGAVIQQSDLKARRALLPENSHLYFSSSADLIGAIVSHHVGAGELIPTSALIEQGSEVDGRYVPLEVAIHDLPANVARGSIVDIYAITKNSTGSASSESTALVAVATLALVAGSTVASTSAQAAGKQKTIGVAVADQKSLFYIAAVDGMKKAAKANNVKLIVLSADNDANKQVGQVNNLLTQNVDLS